MRQDQVADAGFIVVFSRFHSPGHPGIRSIRIFVGHYQIQPQHHIRPEFDPTFAQCRHVDAPFVAMPSRPPRKRHFCSFSARPVAVDDELLFLPVYTSVQRVDI